MKLEIQSLFSPDLDPTDGQPADPADFQVLVSVALGEVGTAGHEVFYFTVSSPCRLATTECGSFVLNTLVLETFDWTAIRNRLQKLLAHCASAESWDAVISRVSGFLRYADAD